MALSLSINSASEPYYISPLDITVSEPDQDIFGRGFGWLLPDPQDPQVRSQSEQAMRPRWSVSGESEQEQEPETEEEEEQEEEQTAPNW